MRRRYIQYSRYRLQKQRAHCQPTSSGAAKRRAFRHSAFPQTGRATSRPIIQRVSARPDDAPRYTRFSANALPNPRRATRLEAGLGVLCRPQPLPSTARPLWPIHPSRRLRRPAISPADNGPQLARWQLATGGWRLATGHMPTCITLCRSMSRCGPTRPHAWRG